VARRRKREFKNHFMRAPSADPGAAPSAASAQSRRRPRRIPLWGNLFLAAGAIGVLVALAAVPHLTGVGRFVIYFLVIAAAAYAHGLTAGLAAAVLSVFSVWYYAAPRVRWFALPTDTALTLGAFALAALATAVWTAAARAGIGRRREVEQLHALLASVVEASDDAIFSVAPDGTIRTWNAGAERLYGYPEAEAVGRSVAMLVPADRAEEVGILLAGLRRGQSYRYETVRMRKDGTRFDVALTISPVKDESGRAAGSSTIARDITARHQAEAQLREHGELLDLSYDAIFAWEFDGGIMFWNRGAEALYGFSQAEAIGRVSHDLLKTVRPSGGEGLRDTLLRTGRWEGELRHWTKDGRELMVDSRHQLIERGSQRLVLEITRDVTGRRRAEERQRVLAEASAALAGSLDVAATLDALTRVVVTTVADVCGVHVIHDGTVVRRFAAAPGDPVKAAVVRELEERYPGDIDAPEGIPKVLRTGTAALYPEITDEMLAAAAPEGGLLDAVRRAGFRSGIFVPLIARGRTLGAMSLITTGAGRRYGTDDLAAAEDLAHRAALALDNALLHEAEQAARREAERAADRITRLQTVTAALSRALTPHEVAGVILAQGIAVLGADAGAVYLLDAEGSSLEMIRSVEYPADVMRERQGMLLSPATPLTESVRSGTPFYLESSDEAMQRYPAVRDHLHPYPGARAIVPMIVRGRPIGTLVFIFRAPGRFAAADREFVEALAAQCAQAMERSALYAHEHQVAATLQQALLPAALPYVPGVVIDAAHRAGTPGAEVGGDWYDAFRLPDGRIVIAIGDVVGRGLEAAVTMGQIRQAIRAAALEGHAPADVLALVGRMLPLAATGRDMTTAIVGVLDSLAGRFTYAAAGHPAPLLATHGRVETLPSGGLPIGFMDRRPAPSWTVDLAPGALLLLYTDGVIESRRDAAAGLAALRAALEQQQHERDPAPAHAILDRLDVRDAPDDVALVAVAVAPNPVDRLDLIVPAEPDSLPIIRHALQHVVRGLALDAQRAFALTVAVGEAVNNVIEHAYVVAAGAVSVRAWRDGTMLRVEVADRGRWRPARPQNDGGRGLIVMRALVDTVDVETTNIGTSVRLAVSLAGEAPAPSPPVDAAATAPQTPAATVTALDGPAPPLPDGQFPIRVSGSACLVEVGGEVDMRTVDRFSAALEHAAAQVAGPLIVSLSGAAYLDSHGVSALFQAATRLRINRRALFLVVSPDSPLRPVLSAVDLADLCPIFGSVDAALSAVSEPAT